MNSLTIKNILTPIFGALATYLAAKLNFLGMDQATWTQLVSSVGFGIVAFLLGLFNKNSDILNAAANQDGVKVVAPADVANAIPNPDVVASTPKINDAIAASK